MAAVSKHYGDVNVWIEKIIDSCDSTKQQQTIYKLIQQFRKMLNTDNTLDYSFQRDIIWKLEIKLDNKIWELHDKKIKEQEN
jgi:predicted nucleotide-binding protein (sugar kinase/HSP70/actin superfamily)